MAASPVPARFDNVNLLRAFAALSVVVFHVIEVGWSAFPASGPLFLFRMGGFGVDLFFVISGFVIAYSALVLHRAEPPAFARRYWARRLTRILPLYLVTLLACLLIFPPQWSLRMWAFQLTSHLTFTFPWSPIAHGAIDGPNWSVGVEMQFYLLVAVLIRWIDRATPWSIAICGVAIAWAWRAATFMLYGGGEVLPLFVRATQLPGMLDEFAAGMVLARLVLDGRRPWFTRAVPWLAGATLLGSAAMAVFWRHPAFWDNGWMVVLWRTLLAAFFMCVVAAAIALPQSVARRWLRPVNYLGEISYGIYLWHMLAVMFIVYQVGLRGLPALLAVVASTLLLAAASWHGFERRFMAWGRGAGLPGR